MNKKDFELIANVMSASKPEYPRNPKAVTEYLGKVFQWRVACEGLANVFLTRENFDYWDFLTACGYSTNGEAGK